MPQFQETIRRFRDISNCCGNPIIPSCSGGLSTIQTKRNGGRCDRRFCFALVLGDAIWLFLPRPELKLAQAFRLLSGDVQLQAPGQRLFALPSCSMNLSAKMQGPLQLYLLQLKCTIAQSHRKIVDSRYAQYPQPFWPIQPSQVHPPTQRLRLPNTDLKTPKGMHGYGLWRALPLKLSREKSSLLLPDTSTYDLVEDST